MKWFILTLHSGATIETPAEDILEAVNQSGVKPSDIKEVRES